jgi:hypothetical protein
LLINKSASTRLLQYSFSSGYSSFGCWSTSSTNLNLSSSDGVTGKLLGGFSIKDLALSINFFG